MASGRNRTRIFSNKSSSLKKTRRRLRMAERLEDRRLLAVTVHELEQVLDLNSVSESSNPAAFFSPHLSG